MGVKVMVDMLGHRREGDNANGRKHDALYWQCKNWVEGEEVDICFLFGFRLLSDERV